MTCPSHRPAQGSPVAALLRIPSLREYAESLVAEEMVRRSLASHAPERYRAKPARRVARDEREGR
ncbi:hypothetical protein ACFY4I_16190 [Streptomyces scabiei]|uniref:hypothetical protein n=1 Tax=Streptomyces scabiei TaxID=1930 RepID=UPI0036921C57